MEIKRVLRKIVKILSYKISLAGAGLLSLVLVSSLLTAYLVRRNPQILGLLKGPEILKKEEEIFVAEVGRKITLPSDEKPTVALVIDAEKLTGQTFFKGAVEGDKVLIYANAKKVILYRPNEQRVIEVGSINIEREQEGEVAGLMDEAFKVALLNGSKVDGATNEIEAKLKEAMPAVEIPVKSNAVNKNYEKSLVVDVVGDKEEAAKELANKLGMEVGELPKGEVKRKGVDLIVIVGNDLE